MQENFLEKIENIKLLKELFVTEYLHLANKLKENKDILENKKTQKVLEQVNLSLNVIKDNINNIKDILNSLKKEISDTEKKKKIKNNSNIPEILVNIQFLTNVFTTEFLFIIKKLEADLKNKKKMPKNLEENLKKINYDIDILSAFVEDLIKELNLSKKEINTDEKKSIKVF